VPYADIFVHVLDHEVLELYGVFDRFSPALIREECEIALKLGYLFTDRTLLIPLSSYFESGLAKDVVDGMRPLAAIGDVHFLSSESNYEAFIDAKREQYKGDRNRYPRYFEPDAAEQMKALMVPLRIRTRSSTKDIGLGWTASIERAEPLWASLYSSGFSGSVEEFEKSIRGVPERLAQAAMIWDFVRPLIPVGSIDRGVTRQGKALISQEYLKSYLREYDAMIVGDLSLGALDFGVTERRRISVSRIRRIMRMADIAAAVERLSWEEAVHIRYRPEFSLFAGRVQAWLSSHDVRVLAEVFHRVRRRNPSVKGLPPSEEICRTAAAIVEEAGRRDGALITGGGFGRRGLISTGLCDALFVVPLREEFRTLLEIVPPSSTEVDDGVHYYRLSVAGYNVFALAIADDVAGSTVAGQVTEKALNYSRPRIIFVIGIGGALDKDLKLGDVVVGSEINEFLAASKAVQVEETVRLQYSGNHWRLDFSAKSAVDNFEFAARELHMEWQAKAREFQTQMSLDDSRKALTREMPRLSVGHIASGPTVGASKAYAVELLGIDRKFLVLETEGAGAAQAGYGRSNAVTTVVIRGISDFADERKRALDVAGNGMWRRYAMFNAVTFLSSFMESELFRSLVEP